MKRILLVVFAFWVAIMYFLDWLEYPGDLPDPDPAWGLFAKTKGDCPDLSGDYDGVRSELTWLLGPNPDFEIARGAWQEHRAHITQADDGSWLRISLDLNERGLPEYRDRLLRYNMESNGSMIHRDLWLEKDKHYACRFGWIYSLQFGQYERVKGMQRKSLKMTKDEKGGLIAGATLSVSHSLFAWGDVHRGNINLDETRWYRWPPRDPSADAELASLQDVTVHRYKWINPGDRIPFRFTSFYLEPICVRFFYEGYPVKVMGPMVRRERDDDRPEELPCEQGWGRFDIGEVFRWELYIPHEWTKPSVIEWYPMNAEDKTPYSIVIDDVRELPLMPEDK